MQNKLALILFISSIVFQASAQINSDISPSPPMGWNSWNWHGKRDINEQLIRETIDAIVEKGLKNAGYEYVVIDGGWRDDKLGSNGELLPHPVKFPNGIKPLVQYAHSKGLKLGLHTVPGTHDCGRDRVGSFGIEEVHISQFIDWDIDFVKLDKCRLEDDWTEEVLKDTYVKWSQILREMGSDIVLSISAYKIRDWYPEVGQMARTTADISSIKHRGANFNKTHQGFYPIALENDKASNYAQKGFWNDPDMLVTGDQGLTSEEEKTHFALWCIMSAPLMLGNDPRISTQQELDIITNRKAIAINQTGVGQGKRVYSQDQVDVWLKKLKKGKSALLFVNTGESESVTFTIQFEKIGLSQKVKFFDVYKNSKLGTTEKEFSFELEPHACQFLIVKEK